MTRPSRAALPAAAALALAGWALTACTTSGAAATDSSSTPAVASSPAPVTRTVTETVPAPVSSPAPTSATGSATGSTAPAGSGTSPAAPTSQAATAAPGPSAGSTAPAPAPGPTVAACRIADLSVTGIRGGAYQGREIGGVLFTNNGNGACGLSGYPGAQLVRNGSPIGQPASDQQGRVRTVVLHPGQTAQVEVTAVTTCQAPISDALRVTVPGDTASSDVALQLRACSLSVTTFSRS